MTSQNDKIKERILIKVLEDIAFDGWTWNGVQNAAEKAGYEQEMAFAVFPNKLEDVLLYFSQWADEKTMNALNERDFSGTGISEKIKQACLTRFKILNPHKEAVRKAAAYWARPFRQKDAAKSIWKTSDIIWLWAGDISEDYNHYTKRSLLTGVLSTTTLRWFNDDTDTMVETEEFLDRRIKNVLTVGKFTGKFIGRFNKVLKIIPLKKKS